MTLTTVAGSLFTLLLIGAVAGLVAIRRANTRKQVRKGQSDRSEFDVFWSGY
jgi:F0F1-type ATP synthase assembly protein I